MVARPMAFSLASDSTLARNKETNRCSQMKARSACAHAPALTPTTSGSCYVGQGWPTSSRGQGPSSGNKCWLTGALPAPLAGCKKTPGWRWLTGLPNSPAFHPPRRRDLQQDLPHQAGDLLHRIQHRQRPLGRSPSLLQTPQHTLHRPPAGGPWQAQRPAAPGQAQRSSA